MDTVMTTVLNNFVVVKKTRGDVLNPAAYRSTVEMINGIIRQGDYLGFKEAYSLFLEHILDLNDPHETTDAGFLDEIIEYTYNIYVDMTPTPLDEEEFRTFIVPSITFLELLKRIFLNKWLYLRIRNTDGSVPESFTTKLSEDWDLNVNLNTDVEYSFSSAIPNEKAFIRSGWVDPTTPRAIVFNALDITTEFEKYDTVFHTSPASPYETITGTTFGYPVTITGSSNDLKVKISVNKAAAQNTTLVSLLNVNRTLTISMSSSSTITVALGTTVIFNNVACEDGKLILSINKTGLFQLTVSNNSVYTTTTNTVNLDTVGILTTALIGIPLENVFTSSFGAKDITILKDSASVGEVPELLPLIFYTPQSSTVPLSNTVSVSGTSVMFVPQLGYKIYLTLSGTWSGTVTLQMSRDGGASWGSITASGEIIGFYSGNCDESITLVSDPLVRFRLVYTIDSGSLTYRLAQ
jgi:hypothetical protein